MATLDRPVVGVYDRTGAFMDWVAAPVSVRMTPRWLEPGDAEVVLRPDDYLAPYMREPGTRIMFALRGHHVLGGCIDRWSTRGPRDESWTFHVTDDAAIMNRILCLPDPAAPLSAQPTTANTWRGPLESVVKTLIRGNAPLLGLDTEIALDLQRGANVAISARWQSVADVAYPVMRAQGMGLTVVWQPDTRKLKVDVTEQRMYPIQLSPESRTVTDYEFNVAAPVATRVYVGPQDGSVFQLVTNDQAEQEWGALLRGATYRSASLTPDPDEAGGVSEAATAASEALNEGNAKSGLSVTLSETPYVRYGGENGLRVGDRAALRIGDVVVEDVVREAVIEFSTSGLSIKPSVGAWDAHPAFGLAAAVRRMATTLRRYTAR